MPQTNTVFSLLLSIVSVCLQYLHYGSFAEGERYISTLRKESGNLLVSLPSGIIQGGIAPAVQAGFVDL